MLDMHQSGCNDTIMNDGVFKYDVAISFVDRDRDVAVRIADALRDRFKVFVYCERQVDVGGKDGALEYSKVFGEQSRVVVVLHRSEWGETNWTRLEQDAIRSRAFDHGWDFTIFVPIEEKPCLPPWFPKLRLYVGYHRWGLDGVCGVVESRVVELGGAAAPASLEDVAAKKMRELEFEAKRAAFRQASGIQWAGQEARQLLGLAGNRIKALPGFQLQVSARGDNAVLVASRRGICLHLAWHFRYINSLDGASLSAVVNDAHPESNQARFEGVRRIGDSLRVVPDLGLDEQPTWVDLSGRIWTLKEVVDEGLKRLIIAIPSCPQ